MELSLVQLKNLATQRLITLKPNKSNTLLIANYTAKVQYNNIWTDLIKQCRGLIIDNAGKIVARPLPKFFNLDQHTKEEIPNEPFEVYEKLDGSLGILYFDEDWRIATRGAFYSKQALKATELLHTKYQAFLPKFKKDKTYLFEIIYPQNRIVVDYGNKEALILLTIIDTESGLEQSIDDFDFPEKAKKYASINNIAQIKSLKDNGKEGFVIRFQSGFRVKVKFAEYIRLHKLLTQVSAKSIWECLMAGENMEELIERVPDEFYKWVQQTKQKLESNFQKIYDDTMETFKAAPNMGNRKDFAIWAKQQNNPSLFFALLDGKKIDNRIWKLIKPKYEKPYLDEV